MKIETTSTSWVELELNKAETVSLELLKTQSKKMDRRTNMSFLWEQPKRLNNAINKVKQQELR